MKKLRTYILKHYYRLWHGIEIEKGYSYKRIKHGSLDVLEKLHHLYLDEGWNRCSDPQAGFKYVSCWYRRKLKQ